MSEPGPKPSWKLEWEAELRAVLERVAVPVYSVEGLHPELGGHSVPDEGEPVESLTIRHDLDEFRQRSIDVSTEIDQETDLEQEAAELVAPSSDGATLEVATGMSSLLIDGVRRPCAFASCGERWAAVAALGRVTVTVEAEGVDASGVHLRALANPCDLVGVDVPEYRPRRPALNVLDPRRVTELAQGSAIQPLAATLASHAQRGIALVESAAARSSWFGGQPALPVSAQWPTGAYGAMTFVAQLALAELDATVWPGPGSGHLHIFGDIDPDSHSIDAAGACAVLHTPADVALHGRSFPDDLHPDSQLAKRSVEPRIGLTIPDAAAAVLASADIQYSGEPDSEFDALWFLAKALHAEQGWQHPLGRLLGWPTWQNDDGMEYLASLSDGDETDWTLLLQTDVIDAELYLALPTADLAVGRFDRCEATIEHD